MNYETIFWIIGIFIAAVYVGSLLRVMWYEKEINKLIKELNEKIKCERSQPQSVISIEGRIGQHKITYEPKIADLERKRRFILEKLPFIKK